MHKSLCYLCTMAKYDIGILGGGQLGKMLIEEGLRYNISFITLDAELESPASFISHEHIQGSLYDGKKVAELVQKSKISTYEIEHIDIDALKKLEQDKHQLIPQPAILEMIQDKGIQKKYYQENNIPSAAYCLVNNLQEWKDAIIQLGGAKVVAKMCQGGYDGKGVAIIDAQKVLDDTLALPWNVPTVVEAFIPCEKEISIMVARGMDGEVKCFPPVEMEFDPEANLVTYLVCPANISEELLKKAEALAIQCVSSCNAIGIFAIEMFVTFDQQILINEMAPRPHNSMHHTIEACYTSQFEQLIRILLRKPLGDTSLIQPAAMINILGGEGFEGAYRLKEEAALLAIPGVYIHLYHKAISKPKRKLGHITVMATTRELLKEKADRVMQLISIVAID